MYIPDKTDWKIIALLNEDGRMPSTEIAQRLGNISARTVNNRIKVLTSEGIVNIRAVVEPEKVGYGVLADIYIEVEPKMVRAVAKEVADFAEVSYVACAAGNVDVSVSLRARSVSEMFDFVTDKIAQIDGVRRTHTYLLPLKIKSQDTWMPRHAVTLAIDDDPLEEPLLAMP